MQILSLLLAAPVSANQIKGVAPHEQHLYVPDENNLFTCVGNPSIKIPMDRVNDNYCDCPDGSDEPGTSACSNGRFWCQGSEQYIPSRLVGDGACDYEVCCDGSDEAPGVCPDRCAEVKAAQAARLEAQLAYIKEGVRIRTDMVAQAKNREHELQSESKALETKIKEVEEQILESKHDLELAKQSDAEHTSDPESVEAVGEIRNTLKGADSDFENLSDRFIQLKDAYLVLDTALKRMSEDYNPNFNDPAVKDAIKTWKNVGSTELDLPSYTKNLLDGVDLLDKIKIASADNSPNSGLGGSWLSYAEELLPPIISRWLLPKSYDAGPRAQKVEEHISTLSSSLDESRKTLAFNKKLLELDESFWGPDEIGRSAENLCVIIQRGDFKYEACLFGTAVQIDGAHNVQLGTATGLKKSPEGQLFIEFKGGNRCNNGVDRHTTLYLECGHETEAFTVGEPETCHYVIKAKSPIACSLTQESSNEVVHDEL